MTDKKNLSDRDICTKYITPAMLIDSSVVINLEDHKGSAKDTKELTKPVSFMP